MLFRKNMEPSCAYCKHGTQINFDRTACVKRGVVPLYGACRRFAYDPLKREPERPHKLPPTGDGERFRL